MCCGMKVPELPDNMSELLDTTIAPNVTLQVCADEVNDIFYVFVRA